jgi:hypothetical protein
MSKLQSNETLLTGAWLVEDGRAQRDATCERIEWLVSHHLEKIADSPESGAWERSIGIRMMGGIGSGPTPAARDWVPKGTRVPAGSELRAHYKGQLHLAEVSSGALVLNGRRFDTPSAAAMSITRHPVNGWTLWEVRLPGQGRWTRLKDLRSGGA